MLGKLLKYEFKSTMRTFLPVYLGTIIFALLTRLFGNVEALLNIWDGGLFAIISLFYVLVICASFVITVILIIQRFYKNLLKDEGYLSHTLPVSTDTHIWGKLIPAAIWSIITGIIIVLSIILLLSTPEVFSQISRYWSSIINDITTAISIPIGLLILELLVLMIISTISSILSYYAAMSLGQLASNHRVLVSVLAYFGLALVLNIVMAPFNNMFLNNDFLDSLFYGSSITFDWHAAMLYCLVSNIIPAAIYYLITRYILRNKLNLE